MASFRSLLPLLFVSSAKALVLTTLKGKAAGSQCAPLENAGYSSFNANLCVGTPPQCFSLIADTGSDSILVPSCDCHDCSQSCFTTAASSTYSGAGSKSGALTFGSGTIEVETITDVASLGTVNPLKAQMSDNAIMLMTSLAELEISNTRDFEGILGLGPPNGGEGSEGLFMAAAHVDRFSVCFKDNGQAGSLKYNLPEFSRPVSHTGKFHWGLDFRGLSVGAKGTQGVNYDILFCSEDSMTAGMVTPCGIIPDSGTTLIIGPKAQVAQLEVAICDAWPRCSDISKDEDSSKSMAFHTLMAGCGLWLRDSDEGLYEMPSLFFDVRNNDGQMRTFELTAWAYVVQLSFGMCKSQIGHGADTEGSDYITEKNGPIWIFGTPLFYEYTVGYSMDSNVMSLESDYCGNCGSATALDYQTGKDDDIETWRLGRPRMAGLPRQRNYNTSIPF